MRFVKHVLHPPPFFFFRLWRVTERCFVCWKSRASALWDGICGLLLSGKKLTFFNKAKPPSSILDSFSYTFPTSIHIIKLQFAEHGIYSTKTKSLQDWIALKLGQRFKGHDYLQFPVFAAHPMYQKYESTDQDMIGETSWKTEFTELNILRCWAVLLEMLMNVLMERFVRFERNAFVLLAAAKMIDMENVFESLPFNNESKADFFFWQLEIHRAN